MRGVWNNRIRAPLSEDHKEKLRLAHLGKISQKRSEETKRKMSEAAKKRGKNSTGMLGKKHSEETKEKISQIKTGTKCGADNPNYKGELAKHIGKFYQKMRHTRVYRKWRKTIFERDNYTCQQCGVSGSTNYLTVHHIKSVCQYPELIINLKNGITLCEDCHSKTDNYKGRARKLIM